MSVHQIRRSQDPRSEQRPEHKSFEYRSSTLVIKLVKINDLWYIKRREPIGSGFTWRTIVLDDKLHRLKIAYQKLIDADLTAADGLTSLVRRH
jgi:hypothetical protein